MNVCWDAHACTHARGHTHTHTRTHWLIPKNHCLIQSLKRQPPGRTILPALIDYTKLLKYRSFFFYFIFYSLLSYYLVCNAGHGSLSKIRSAASDTKKSPIPLLTRKYLTISLNVALFARLWGTRGPHFYNKLASYECRKLMKADFQEKKCFGQKWRGEIF